MKIQILGTGCANCRMLEANARQAVEKKDLEANIVLVSDADEIAALGGTAIPTLVIDGKVQSPGTVLTIKEIMALI